MIESLLVLPLLILITLGIVQYSFIYHAKSSLDYASFMSARAGAVDHINKNSILNAFINSMQPLYAHDGRSDVNNTDVIVNDIKGNTVVQIMNPSREAFLDFAKLNKLKNIREIPNHRLHVASVKKGPHSQLNIQDANILKLQIVYGYQLKIPFVNTIIIKAASMLMKESIQQDYLKKNRLPILSTAIVRMQSPAAYNSWVQSRFEVEK